MGHPNGIPATTHCRKCRRSVAFTSEFCPKCGTADPAGLRAALVGSLIVGMLAASAVTGIYAWIVAWDWDRWERKFGTLRPDHPLADAPWETAVGLGIVVFLFTWVVTAALLSRFVASQARRVE
jgi:hypothetical protein